MIPGPLNLPKWLEENSHLLQPPVNNYCVYDEDVTVMIVGGPNARTDYHINTTPEWFYQYRGTLLLKIIDNGIPRTLPITEGSMFLLPPNVPHNPIRFANTVGIVIEQRRPEGSVDKMRWYCPNVTCGKVVHEVEFHCVDLGTQIKEQVQAYSGEKGGRDCSDCGTFAPARPAEGEIEDPNLEGKGK
ncbi:3-hydroxyanthranilic acid dioxygenase [Pseudogymnoascus verrucosus]|uniref:3-hydroxyanthranilate 3,4-dioxygenase n=1 Tax=Pseudogymnoascus verrucosus TaxID=342668 RepID=A0A1B8GIW8_9PEZI|nr:3-hydroxyanthranilic acid dioxygenase [Pseudogymnoascus verrucosus]OBT95759.1 3-hydroxyanthranilic acid dioxygenase [Pseudogymnoascus verrucosus]